MRTFLQSLAILIVHGSAALAEPMPELTRAYGPSDAPNRLVVRGTTDISLFEPVLDAFLAINPRFAIDYEQWGSNDLYAIAASECQEGESGADLMISSSVDQQVRLTNDGCTQPHRRPLPMPCQRSRIGGTRCSASPANLRSWCTIVIW